MPVLHEKGGSEMICPHCKKHFADPGRVKGGKASKRKITPEQQAKMQAARGKGKSSKRTERKG